MEQKHTSRYLATISLAIMACGFIATIPFQKYTVFVILQGGFEAGLVGGLADWFAVTALFRHPLRIPIPHTALLVKNRQRLIDALVNVLENDWLTKESIKNKLGQISLFKKLAAFFEQGLYSDALKKWIIGELAPFAAGIDAESLAPHIEKGIKAYVNSVDVKPLLAGVKSYAWGSGLPQKALDYAVLEAERWAEKDETKTTVGAVAMRLLNDIKADGLLKWTLGGIKMFLDEKKLGEILQPVIQEKINELKADDNELRLRIFDKLDCKIEDMLGSEEIMSAVNEWKNDMADNFGLSDKIAEALGRQRDRLAAALRDEVVIEDKIFPYIRNFCGNVLSSPEKTEKIEAWIHRMIGEVVDANHAKIGRLVRENLDKLDDKTLVAMMENNLGKDLQWIRVNGAVCGFLIGIGLTLIKMVI